MSSQADAGSTIFDAMVRFFQEDDWTVRQSEGKPVLVMGFKGKNGSWECVARAREEQKQFAFYSVLNANVPQERRPQVAEFLTRANYGLIVGNFEMDYADGEVRFKTGIDVENCEDALATGLIRNLVYANVLMMDKYFPGIMAVMYGGGSPEEAIAKIER